MANVLKMADQAAIIALWRRGWSRRRIARETGIHRETVGRYVRLARAGLVPGAPGWDRTKPANSTAGSGRQSLCEPFREIIEGKVEAGLTAQRIWQDLVGEHAFDGGYQSVKRFCRRMRATLPLPFRRMECEPGTEAQVDFGTGAPVVIPDGQPLTG